MQLVDGFVRFAASVSTRPRNKRRFIAVVQAISGRRRMYDFGIRNALSGYRVAYRQQEQNHCPGCGKSHWMIGRLTAECAFCGVALPLVAGANIGNGLIRHSGVTALAA
jgi:hypothetical protein